MDKYQRAVCGRRRSSGLRHIDSWLHGVVGQLGIKIDGLLRRANARTAKRRGEEMTRHPLVHTILPKVP